VHLPNRAFTSIAVCVIAFVGAARPSFAVESQWIGGHSNNWSDPLNWIGNVPTNGDSVRLFLDASVPPLIFQDLSGGVLVSGFTSTQGNPPTRFFIDGNRIDLAAGSGVTFAGPGSPGGPHTPIVFNAPVRLLGATTLACTTQNLSPQFGYYAHLFDNLTGAGSVTSTGQQSLGSDHVILRASYTGTTTVRSGVLRLGGAVYAHGMYSFHDADTTNQGDYLVMSGATLTGMGTVGLTPGATVTVSGTIVPGHGGYLGLGEDGGVDLRINGDLVLADGGTYAANFLGRFSDLIVNGTADLRGAGDRLSLIGPLNFLTSGTYVVMEYQNRLGAFDVISSSYITNVTYTTPENGGPGQVLITVPEPAGAAAVAGAILAPLRVRRRR
jgi:hypothetical protein